MTSSMHPSILGVCGKVSSYAIRCLMDNIETGLEVENLVDADDRVTFLMSCSCAAYMSTLIPCRHVLAVILSQEILSFR